MRLIRWEKKGELEGWQTYRWQKQQWQFEKRYTLSGQEHVYQFLSHQKEAFTWAFIGLNIVYRNTFYALMPKVHVIISPQSLFHYMHHFDRLPNGYHEEVAICLDDTLQDEREEVYCFLEAFYKAKTAPQARAIYEKWQLSRSLSNVIADKLQIVIQLFEEEIFNYFIYGMLLPDELRFQPMRS